MTQQPDPAFERLATAAAELPTSGSQSQHAYNSILHGIMTGILTNGKRLPEIPLGKALGLGRTPVREALMRLEGDGFVRSEPRVGVVVAGNTIQSFAEIHEVMEVLDSFAARLAARAANPTNIVLMKSILAEMELATEAQDIPRLRSLNSRFHDAIHLAAHNDQLRRVQQRLLNLIRLSPTSAYAVPGRADEALVEHYAILEAIEERDEDRACSLAAMNIRKDKELRLNQLLELETQSSTY